MTYDPNVGEKKITVTATVIVQMEWHDRNEPVSDMIADAIKYTKKTIEEGSYSVGGVTYNYIEVTADIEDCKECEEIE